MGCFHAPFVYQNMYRCSQCLNNLRNNNGETISRCFAGQSPAVDVQFCTTEYKQATLIQHIRQKLSIIASLKCCHLLSGFNAYFQSKINRLNLITEPETVTKMVSGEAWLYILAVIINAINLFLQVFFTIMYSDLEW